jgi:hypothetical protein
MRNNHFGGQGPCRFEGGTCRYCDRPETSQDIEDRIDAYDQAFDMYAAKGMTDGMQAVSDMLQALGVDP